MSDISTFVHECLASGGLILLFAATLSLPLIAWFLSRPALALVGGDGAPRPRALAFAILATTPGVSFAGGTAAIVIGAYRTGCLAWPGGRMIVATVVLIFASFALRASARAWKLWSSVRELRAVSSLPSERLARASRAAGLSAREVSSSRAILCLVGVRRPLVIVSDAALARLNDTELRAALEHEKAHACHFDQIVMSLVAFFADLFPMPVRTLTEGYRVAREFAADRRAVRTVDAFDLAQAIYRLASPNATSAAGAALADRGAIARIRALLEPDAPDDAQVVRKLSLLVAGQVLVATTLVALGAPLAVCRMVG